MTTRASYLAFLLENVRLWASRSDEQRESIAQELIQFYRDTEEPRSVAQLAEAFADSGSRWQWDDSPATADVPSTGGPASLTTLLCPAILAAAGAWVPKLGVPGSVAGALDVLGLLPGYRTELDWKAARAALEASGIANCSGTDAFCPADRDMFTIRSRSGAKKVPSLVASSLLSKKLAIGCSSAALDVRCGPGGNVGEDRAKCVRFSTLFVEAARSAGISASCVITSSTPPPMRYFGRRESLWALKSALMEPECLDRWTAQHVQQCISVSAHALVAAGIQSDLVAAEREARNCLESGRAYEFFKRNLSAQGSSEDALHEYLAVSVDSTAVEATASGFVNYFPSRLRSVVRRMNGSSPDAIGVVLRAEPGSWVRDHEQVLTVRSHPKIGIPVLRQAIIELTSCFAIELEEPTPNCSDPTAVTEEQAEQ